MPKSLGYNKYAIHLCWRLLTANKDEIALMIVRSMVNKMYNSDEPQATGGFFINQLVKLDRVRSTETFICGIL